MRVSLRRQLVLLRHLVPTWVALLSHVSANPVKAQRSVSKVVRPAEVTVKSSLWTRHALFSYDFLDLLTLV